MTTYDLPPRATYNTLTEVNNPLRPGAYLVLKTPRLVASSGDALHPCESSISASQSTGASDPGSTTNFTPVPWVAYGKASRHHCVVISSSEVEEETGLVWVKVFLTHTYGAGAPSFQATSDLAGVKAGRLVGQYHLPLRDSASVPSLDRTGAQVISFSSLPEWEEKEVQLRTSSGEIAVSSKPTWLLSRVQIFAMHVGGTGQRKISVSTNVQRTKLEPHLIQWLPPQVGVFPKSITMSKSGLQATLDQAQAIFESSLPDLYGLGYPTAYDPATFNDGVYEGGPYARVAPPSTSVTGTAKGSAEEVPTAEDAASLGGLADATPVRSFASRKLPQTDTVSLSFLHVSLSFFHHQSQHLPTRQPPTPQTQNDQQQRSPSPLYQQVKPCYDYSFTPDDTPYLRIDHRGHYVFPSPAPGKSVVVSNEIPFEYWHFDGESQYGSDDEDDAVSLPLNVPAARLNIDAWRRTASDC